MAPEACSLSAPPLRPRWLNQSSVTVRLPLIWSVSERVALAPINGTVPILRSSRPSSGVRMFKLALACTRPAAVAVICTAAASPFHLRLSAAPSQLLRSLTEPLSTKSLPLSAALTPSPALNCQLAADGARKVTVTSPVMPLASNTLVPSTSAAGLPSRVNSLGICSASVGASCGWLLVAILA